MLHRLRISRLLILLLITCGSIRAQTPVLSGELKTWHKITLTWDGPASSETAVPNPFTDYALDVTFSQGSNTYTVPGYFAADGDAAETSAESGNKWRAHFAPDATGVWNYAVSFKTGTDVTVDGGGSSAGFMDGTSGSFTVAPTDKAGRDHRGKGRLIYVDEHYLQYAATGEWFVKAGADAPENTLAYEDFDDVPNQGGRRKSWQPHQQDYDPAEAAAYTWQGGKGTELLGVINYLSGKNVNAFSFLTFNIMGDDRNVFPHLIKAGATYGGNDAWSNDVHKDRFDISRMAQWERIFAYADQKGMFMHFKTQETENDQLMDGGDVGRERKLYYRELIARFGHHLALNWNMGEENTQTTSQRRAMADYFAQTDPYGHLRVIHTFPNQKEQVYAPLLGGNSSYTGLSLQTSNPNQTQTFTDTEEWVRRSAAAGQKWVVAIDEPGNATIGVDSDPDDRKLTRHRVVWGNFMAGGTGSEFYYGYQSGCGDLECQDHRTRDQKYTDAALALRFFQLHFQQYLPVVVNDNGLTADNNDFVLAKPGVAYAVYRPDGGTTSITLPQGTWEVRWYNPRSGDLGPASTITNGNLMAPDGEDWTALISLGTCVPATACNDGNDCTQNDQFDANCNCVGTFADADMDGICDSEDVCPNFDDALIGTPCDDGNPCTTGDTYRSDCNCSGVSGTADQLELTAIDDAYLQNGNRVNNTELRIEQGIRVSYLKFDISDFSGTLTAAQLTLKVGSDNGSGNIVASLGDGNNWTENNLSTSNAPAEAILLGQLDETYDNGQTYSWDLDVSGLSSGLATIIMRQASGNDIAVLSDENDDLTGRPTLTLTIDSGSEDCAALPLNWEYFTVAASGKSAQLNWGTSAEENVSHFTITHSTSGQAFREVGRVLANNQSGNQQYAFTHEGLAAGLHLYQIIQEDIDGSRTVSPVRSFQLAATQPLVFPNPVTAEMYVQHLSPETHIRLLNTVGATVKVWKTSAATLSVSLQDLPAGIYFLHGNSRAGTWTQRIVKR